MTARSTQISADLLDSLAKELENSKVNQADEPQVLPTVTNVEQTRQDVRAPTPTTPPPASTGKTDPVVEGSYWVTGTDQNWRNIKLTDFPRAASIKNDDSTVIFLERQTVDPASKEANNRAVLKQLGAVTEGFSSQQVQTLADTIAASGSFSSEPPKGKPCLALFTVDPTTKAAVIRYIPLVADSGRRPDKESQSTKFGGSISLNPGANFPVGGSLDYGTTWTRSNDVTIHQTSLDVKVGAPVSGVSLSTGTVTPHQYNGQTYRVDKEVVQGGVSFSFPLSLYAGVSYDKTHLNSSGNVVTDLSVQGTIRPTGPGVSITTENDSVKLQAMYNNLNLFGVPVSTVVPGMWGVGLTVKGSDTPWIVDKASGSWVSYQGSDGKPGMYAGVVGAGPFVLPYIFPGEGAMPDRVIKLPQVVVEAMTAAEISKSGLDMIPGRQVQRVVGISQSFMQSNQAKPIIFFPAEGGINALATRDMTRYPELAKNFEKLTGVPLVSKEGVQLTREQVQAEVWKWFEKQNPELIAQVSKGLSSTNATEKEEAQRNLEALKEFATRAVGMPLIPSPDDCRKLYENERKAKPNVPRTQIPWEDVNKPKSISQRNPYIDKFDLNTERVVDVVAVANTVTGKDGRRYVLSQSILSIDVVDESKKKPFEPRTTQRPPTNRTQVTIEELRPIPDGMPDEVAVQQARETLKQRELSMLQTAHNIMAEAWRQNKNLDEAAARVVQALQPEGGRPIQKGQSPGDRRRELLQQVNRVSQ